MARKKATSGDNENARARGAPALPLLELMRKWWGLIMALIALVYSYAGLNISVRNLEERVNDIDRTQRTLQIVADSRETMPEHEETAAADPLEEGID